MNTEFKVALSLVIIMVGIILMGIVVGKDWLDRIIATIVMPTLIILAFGGVLFLVWTGP